MASPPVAHFTILGEAASKANQRRIVKIGGRSRIIKSKKAISFAQDARRQVPSQCRLRLDVPVAVRIDLHYASERPDLDEALVLDALQDHFVVTRHANGSMRRDLVQPGVYTNDRRVRMKLIIHHIDRINPRAEVQVWPLERGLLDEFPFELPLPF